MTAARIELETESLADSAVSARDILQRKTRRTETRKILIGDEPVEITIVARNRKELNALLEAHPPRKSSPDDLGLPYNTKSFPPALFAVSITDPVMTEDEWVDIWDSPEWAPGELSSLLDAVWTVSNAGLNVPFGGRG